MAITPTNSLFTALSSLGVDNARPRPAPEAARPPVSPAPSAQPQGHHGQGLNTTQTSAPEPSRPLPRGSLVNIVI